MALMMANKDAFKWRAARETRVKGMAEFRAPMMKYCFQRSLRSIGFRKSRAMASKPSAANAARPWVVK